MDSSWFKQPSNYLHNSLSFCSNSKFFFFFTFLINNDWYQVKALYMFNRIHRLTKHLNLRCALFVANIGNCFLRIDNFYFLLSEMVASVINVRFFFQLKKGEMSKKMISTINDQRSSSIFFFILTFLLIFFISNDKKS